MLKKEPVRVVLESLTHPLYKLYSGSLRYWEYYDMEMVVKPGIFHPGWFVTSVMLLETLETIDVKGKSVLEMGCGAGALACRAAQKGALSFGSDITNSACTNTDENALKNGLDVHVLQSDLFDQMDESYQFDFIFVNPPFIPRYPESEDDFAFCCGEGYEYYISLFDRLKNHLLRGGEMIMALAKSCDLNRILEIADLEKVNYERITSKRKWSETNYLYRFSFQG
ncbi:MAG: class I SAM-dependent methyltransferase [Bacteroidota bacterium]